MLHKKGSPNSQGDNDQKPHAAFDLAYMLKKHKDFVNEIKLSPNGRILASSSKDGTILLWFIDNGALFRTFQHDEPVRYITWSSDSNIIASATRCAVYLWDIKTGNCVHVIKMGLAEEVFDLEWSPDNRKLAIAVGSRIMLWDVNGARYLTKEHFVAHNACMAWRPTGDCLVVGDHNSIKIMHFKKESQKAHERMPERNFLNVINGDVTSIAWSPDGRFLAYGLSNYTVCIHDLENNQAAQILESHTDRPISLTFLDNGRIIASLSMNGELIIWQTGEWNKVAHINKIGLIHELSNITSHPKLPIIVSPGETWNSINVWRLDLAFLHDGKFAQPTIHYVNSKAVLLGDSSVGKSGLGIRIAEDIFRVTESTHGAQFWHIPVKKVPGLPDDLHAELTLWDLAGQPEYRLIHQLFLDDTDAAMLLFDCSDSNDPFHGVPYWAKVLRKHAPPLMQQSSLFHLAAMLAL